MQTVGDVEVCLAHSLKRSCDGIRRVTNKGIWWAK